MPPKSPKTKKPVLKASKPVLKASNSTKPVLKASSSKPKPTLKIQPDDPVAISWPATNGKLHVFGYGAEIVLDKNHSDKFEGAISDLYQLFETENFETSDNYFIAKLWWEKFSTHLSEYPNSIIKQFFKKCKLSPCNYAAFYRCSNCSSVYSFNIDVLRVP